jgi:DNA-binding ferritin-like protein (Dps family)
MIIIELKERNDISENKKLNRIYIQFQEILKELRKKELPQKIIESISQDVIDLNSTVFTGKELQKYIKQKQKKILKQLEKEIKIVPKDYYKVLWSIVGLSVFGTPIGMILGLILMDNISLFAAGVPFGMIIGMIIGSEMDKKAFKEGRQLNIKIRY